MKEISIKQNPDGKPDAGVPQSRGSTQTNGTQSDLRASDPGIRDAVRDQHGAPWIRYGTEAHSLWFAAAGLVGVGTEVFTRLARVGPPLLTEASKTNLKRAIETYPISREALVAARPGWLDEHPIFTFGDGVILKPKSEGREIIVAFEPNLKFALRGTLREWQKKVEPFVRHQPLPYFAVAFALVGPLLHFLQRGQLNPIVEVVGERETGKSTVGVLAASVWAGDPDSHVGGGESWHLTINAIDDLKLGHRDGFLFLDEGNLVGVPGSKLPEFLQDAIFKLSSNRGKRRMGDPGASETANVATLSTTNTPLRELVGGNAARRAALESRLITLAIPSDHHHGVFDVVPEGFASSRKAAEALQKAADACWGTPARKFIGKLARRAARDEEQLRRRIAKRVDQAINELPSRSKSARVQKTFALVAVAAGLAQEWGVFPMTWGSPTAMASAVARLVADGQIEDVTSPIERVRAYVDQHRASLIDVATLARPLPKSEFEACPGFLWYREGRTELLIPVKRFQSHFADYKIVMNALRANGQARTENGKQKKLSYKSPKAICAESRLYWTIIS